VDTCEKSAMPSVGGRGPDVAVRIDGRLKGEMLQRATPSGGNSGPRAGVNATPGGGEVITRPRTNVDTPNGGRSFSQHPCWGRGFAVPPSGVKHPSTPDGGRSSYTPSGGTSSLFVSLPTRTRANSANNMSSGVMARSRRSWRLPIRHETEPRVPQPYDTSAIGLQQALED
jgi:hypothetical protein